MENTLQQNFTDNFPNHGFRYIPEDGALMVNGKNNQTINSWVERQDLNKKHYGAFFNVNGFSKGFKEEHLISLNAFFADIDWEKGIEQSIKKTNIQELYVKIDSLGLTPSAVIETKKGCHIYWILEKPETRERIEEWRSIEDTIIEKLGGDKQAKDPCRVLRVPNSIHWKDKNSPFTISVWADTGARYSWSDIVKVFPPSEHKPSTSHNKKSLTELVGLAEGGEGRNPAIASLVGKLLRTVNPVKWREEVLPVALQVNATFKPPLPVGEIEKTFESIARMELRSRQEKKKSEKKNIDQEIETEKTADGEIVPLLQRASKGAPHNNEQNVLRNLHFYFKDRLKYNTFTERIEFDGRQYQDDDVGEIVAFMQTKGCLPMIPRKTVELALITYALRNSYDEAKDFLEQLVWDRTERLATWLVRATGIEDNEFNRTAPANWLQNGLIRRLYNEKNQWHFVLALIGGQGTGKTSLFQALGGEWYKSYAGGADSKDLAILCTGAAVMDLDEGVAVSKTDYARMKSFISQPIDEYRSPYARRSTRHHRRFVFSMTTNASTPLRDPTGNRRYWIINTGNNAIDHKWVKENREQLFAEALYNIKNHIKLPDVPYDAAIENQESSVSEDPWTEDVLTYVSDRNETSVRDVFLSAIAKDVNEAAAIARLDKFVEMRIAEILNKNEFEKKRIQKNGMRVWKWYRIVKISEQTKEQQEQETEDIFNNFGKD